jgi:hypothetical protein
MDAPTQETRPPPEPTGQEREATADGSANASGWAERRAQAEPTLAPTQPEPPLRVALVAPPPRPPRVPLKHRAAERLRQRVAELRRQAASTLESLPLCETDCCRGHARGFAHGLEVAALEIEEFLAKEVFAH